MERRISPSLSLSLSLGRESTLLSPSKRRRKAEAEEGLSTLSMLYAGGEGGPLLVCPHRRVTPPPPPPLSNEGRFSPMSLGRVYEEAFLSVAVSWREGTAPKGGLSVEAVTRFRLS